MRGMNSDSVDLIYLDPPFNSKRNYAAPIGSEAAGAEFKDTWTLNDIDKEWINLIANKHPKLHRVLVATMTNSDKSYLVYMAVRLLEMKRILKPTGSIYLHCDPTMSHYLKLVMDAIFDRDNFRNEIIWKRYRGKRAAKNPSCFARVTDTILFYTKTSEYGFDLPFSPLRDEYVKSVYKHDDLDGKGPYRFGGRIPGRKYYLSNSRGIPAVSLWDDIDELNGTADEATGYPTQKPLALLDRIINTSSKKGDIVFDPFCGCATTLVAADGLKRDWIGIDISLMATRLVKDRIKDQQGLWRKVISRDDIPQRTDLGKLPHPKTHKKTLFGEQEGKCNGCGHRFNIENLDVDHIIAKSKGGTDHIDNLQLLCGYCNSTKGDRGMEYLIQRLKLDDKALGIKRL